MVRTPILVLAIAAVAGASHAQPSGSGIGQALSAPQPLAAPEAGGSGRFGARHFGRMDADHDGKVTEQEFVTFGERRFQAMDGDHDGRVTKAEFDAAFARRQAERAGRMTRRRNAQAGEEEQGGGPADGSAQFAGLISREEYDAMLRHRFERMDAAHKGFLTADDMHGGGQGRGDGGAGR